MHTYKHMHTHAHTHARTHTIDVLLVTSKELQLFHVPNVKHFDQSVSRCSC